MWVDIDWIQITQGIVVRDWACPCLLTHWGRVTHICVSKLSIIGSDNGLSPGRHQAIIWSNAGILLIGSLGVNSSDNWIGIETFSIKKMHLKMLSAKWRLFGLSLNELMHISVYQGQSQDICCLNTLMARQNGRHFTDDTFKCIFLNQNVWIFSKVSRKLVPKGPIHNIPVLVQIMAWRHPGDKPLSEPTMGS